ncbi:MAG: radical SAM protein, partial [Candidatus Omnitrophota bacterium]
MCWRKQKRSQNIIFIHRYPQITGIVLGVTYRCNAKCRHCSQADFRDEAYQAQEMSVKEIGSLFTEFRKFKVKSVNLFGGEPLLRNDLVDIIKAGSSKGIEMSFETNAFLLNEINVLEFKKSGINKIIIGLDYAEALLQDDFKGVKGIWNKAIESIELCKQYKIACHISVVAMKDSIENNRLRALFELARDMKVDEVRVMNPMQMGRWRHSADEIFSRDEYRELKNLVSEYSDIACLNCHDKSNIIHCGPLKRISFFINAFGDVMPCC